MAGRVDSPPLDAFSLSCKMENSEVCSSLPDEHFEHASSGTSVHVAAGRIHSFSQKGLPRESILQ